MQIGRPYLRIELSKVRSVERALEHEQYPDLIRRTRERWTPDLTVEEYQIGRGSVFMLGRQRTLVYRTAVGDESLLTRMHVSLQPVRQ